MSNWLKRVIGKQFDIIGKKKSMLEEKDPNKEEVVAEEQQEENQEVENQEENTTEEADSNEESNEANEWENKFNELNDKYLRLFSEFDNYKRRTAKEKLELADTASEGVMKVLLPILDDFDRAVKSFEETTDVESIKEGVDLIHKKLVKSLEQKGLQSTDSLHEEFNPDIHEALTNIPAPEEDLKGKVVDVIEKGYTLNEKIIRYAKVVVGN